MYEPIDQEFLNSENKNATPMPSASLTNEEREVFADSFLTKYLGEDKLREKDSLREKIKFKKQQLELATKHLKKAKKKQAMTSQTSKIKKKKLNLSCKLKKSLKMYKLNKNEKLDYSKYESVNNLWKSYAHSCLLTCLPPNLDANKFELSEENVLNCLKVISKLLLTSLFNYFLKGNITSICSRY